jgi:hypothetical protein
MTMNVVLVYTLAIVLSFEVRKMIIPKGEKNHPGFYILFAIFQIAVWGLGMALIPGRVITFYEIALR